MNIIFLGVTALSLLLNLVAACAYAISKSEANDKHTCPACGQSAFEVACNRCGSRWSRTTQYSK